MRLAASVAAACLLACGGSATSGRNAPSPPSAATIHVAPPEHGSVRSNPAGIDCGTSCTAAFAAGIVALHAVPDDGYTLQGWGGACAGTGDCALVLGTGQSVEVSAAFIASSSPPPPTPSPPPPTSSPPPPPPNEVRYHVVDLGFLDPGWTSAVPRAIAGGHVVGYGFQAGVSVEEAFYWDGAMHAVVPPTVAVGAGGSTAAGVNASGDVVGTYTPPSATSIPRAYLAHGSTFTDLGALSQYGAVGNGVSGNGTVVGTSWVDATHAHAFEWDAATGMHDLGTLGSCEYAAAVGVNDAGQAAGNVCTRAVLFDHGQVVDLGTLGGTFAYATGINAVGQIAGFAATVDSAHGFVWDNGHMTDVGTLAPGQTSDLAGINVAGVAVGSVRGEHGDHHAIIYRDGKLTDLDALLDDPGWHLMEAVGIDDEGRIAAVAPAGGRVHAVLLVPR